MSQTTPSISADLPMSNPSNLDELRQQIKRLNSKAGQMKMDLHDIAEGLPNDLDQLPDIAARTFEIFCQLRNLKQQLKTLEEQP